MATESSVNVPSAGAASIATFSQTQNSQTVEVQQVSLVDSTIGTGSVVDSNGLHVVLEKGTPNASAVLSNTSLAAGANATLTSAVVVTNGKTGTLQHAIFAGTQPILWQLQTINNSSVATTVVSFITDANTTFDFKPGANAEISTVLSTGVATFAVNATNLSTNASVNASVYGTFFWAEN